MLDCDKVIQEQDPACRPSKVTILASEWGSSKGGISTINRELAIQLAKCSEFEVTLFVPQCSEEDKNKALSHNINILEATRRPGFEELEWLSFPPEQLQIDIIVGHGVKLGRQAQIIRLSHKCKWVQVVHTGPGELGMFRSYSGPTSKDEEKQDVEVELCLLADFVVGVGPKLFETSHSNLWCKKDQTVLEFSPGVFDNYMHVKQVPDARKHYRILVFSRRDNEDFEFKGFDITGIEKAFDSLPDTHCVFVGAPDRKHEEIAKRLFGYDIPLNHLKVRIGSAGHIQCH